MNTVQNCGGSPPEASREKRSVALSSVVAAFFLTLIKYIVGLMTGSIGLISEAVHSLFDLVAALVTFFAVRAADKPPDEKHRYGHGKIESFSALVETLLLLVTCIWIINESLGRLFYREAAIEVNAWGYAVLVVSIVVNLSRAKALYATARRYNSQALEADALHFSSDILSSIVVIVGLFLVSMGYRMADPIAALIVAFIIIYACFELGKKALEVLLDTAPGELATQIEEITRNTSGIVDASSVRVRQAGSRTFVDMTVSVPRTASFSQSHSLTEEIESRVMSIVPGADILIHTEPIEEKDENLCDKIRVVACDMSLQVHDIHIHNIKGVRTAELHLELDRNMPLKDAHGLATSLEKGIVARVPVIHEVTTHIESATFEETDGRDLTGEIAATASFIEKMSLEMEGVRDCHDVSIKKAGNGLCVSLHCLLDDNLPLCRVHDISTDLESRLKAEIPVIRKVLVHAEPWHETVNPEAIPQGSCSVKGDPASPQS